MAFAPDFFKESVPVFIFATLFRHPLQRSSFGRFSDVTCYVAPGGEKTLKKKIGDSSKFNLGNIVELSKDGKTPIAGGVSYKVSCMRLL